MALSLLVKFEILGYVTTSLRFASRYVTLSNDIVTMSLLILEDAMIIMMQHNEEEEKVAQEARRQELLEKERFFPGEAVEYLLLVRGIKTSVVSLRGRRGRKTIEAEHEGYRNTTYTKAQLDAYKVAPQTKVVPGSEAAQRREEMRRNRGRRKKAPKNH